MEKLCTNLDLYVLLKDYSLKNNELLYEVINTAFSLDLTLENQSDLCIFCKKYCYNRHRRWVQSSYREDQFINNNKKWLKSLILWPTCVKKIIEGTQMWPLLIQFMRSNAPYLTLPFAAIVGVIGYNLENILSDKYTPFNQPIQDQRVERLTDEDNLSDPTNVQKLKYKENVLGKNVPPSLQKN